MRIHDAKPVLCSLIQADVPAFLWGAPGVGKSDLVREIAADIFSGRILDFRATLIDPVDLRGIPSVADGLTRWNPPAFLPNAERDGESGLLFLDELNAAPGMVQAAFFQLILDRKLGEYSLPAGWRILAAGNRQSDRAAAQRMPSALANRFAHVDIDPDVESWCAWATRSGIRPEIVAFVRFRPELLHKMDSDARAFPTPRAWAKVSASMATTPGNLVFQVAESIVGTATAAEFKGFLDVFKSLPRIDSILADPASAPVPAEPSARYAIASALARMATAVNLPAVISYVSRLPAEFAVMCVTDATRREPALKETAAYVQWGLANRAVLA